MRKIYHLATCDTCRKILKEVAAEKKQVILQDIKTEHITAAQVDEMKKMAGSYEALFSKKAIKYREMGLANKPLTENDFRQLILEEYTFLKRPVAIIGNKIIIGNQKASIESLKEAL